MIYIEKSEEPEFLSEFKRKNPDKTYDSEEFAHYRGILTDVHEIDTLLDISYK